MNDPHIRQWQEAEAHLGAHRMQQARAQFERLAAQPTWVGPARLRLAQIASGSGHLREAVEHILAAAGGDEDDVLVLEAIAGTLCELGEIEAFLHLLRSSALADTMDATVLVHLARLLGNQSFPEHALPLLRRARQLGRDDAELHYQTGLSLLYLGELDEAAAAFEHCLRLAPLHAACHRQVARLRRATTSHNHVEVLRQTLAALGPFHSDAPPLHYALFKELDDLDDLTAAWDALASGMRVRRSQIQHDLATEAHLFARLQQMPPGNADEVREDTGAPIPIFIIGQPRSGTTLLERLLASTGEVADAGELRDFAFQLRWTCDRAGPAEVDAELAARLVVGALDFAQLGQRYRSHTAWRAGGKGFYTDKLPANFMLAGAIARALPEARLVHLHRTAPDVCFSNLKELFAYGYSHSYDQFEMATHYRHYRALMAHWHTVLPGRILDISYEELVTRPEVITRQVQQFCGLSRQPSASTQVRTGKIATASSVQLRQPVDGRYVDGWKRYRRWLGPLLRELGEFAPDTASVSG